MTIQDIEGAEDAAERTSLPKKRAVAYLRVSTPRQSRTDLDSDGFSLETQREAAYRKAAEKGAIVVEEYIDTDTGTKRSGRNALEVLLERLKTKRDIDYVIVFKLDRWARNRLDDAMTSLAVHQAGAELVSCSEHIDRSAVGKLNHGILAAVNEYYSDNLSDELKQKMLQKVKRGGTPGQCSLGYLNVRQNIDGKNIGTVIVDPDRAPIIKWALEAFAGGQYTVASLTEELVALGLVTRPTARQGGKPVTPSFVGRMLRNAYYIGLVTWGGVQVKGNHEPLISVETFAQNQAILESHRFGEKQRIHPHYLRSTITCKRCGSRMCFTKAKGRGGVYDYFFCLGRHQKRTDCDLPYLLVEDIEGAISEHYASTELLTDQQEASLRDLIDQALAQRTKRATAETKRQSKRIEKLEGQRDKLLDAYLTGSVPVEVLKRKQDAITAELAQAHQALTSASLRADVIRQNLDKALTMIREAAWAYQEASPQGRRHWNQAMFDSIEVDHRDTVYTRLADPFAQLVERDLLRRLEQEAENPGPSSPVRGLKDDYLAEGVGFEPTVSFPTHAFQACRFGRSRTPPRWPPRRTPGAPFASRGGHPTTGQGIVSACPPCHVAAGSCATAVREPSQGRKAAALSGACGAPQIAWSPLARAGTVAPRRHRARARGRWRRRPVASPRWPTSRSTAGTGHVSSPRCGARRAWSTPCATPCAKTASATRTSSAGRVAPARRPRRASWPRR